MILVVRVIDGEILIYNVFGDVVKRIEKLNSNSIEISSEALAPGIYICRVFDKKNKIFGTGKLIIQ